MNKFKTTIKPLTLMTVCLLSVTTAGCAGYGHGNDAVFVSQDPIVTTTASPQRSTPIFTPLPQQQPVTTIPLPAPMLVIYSADSFFDFDKVAVKQASKHGLDQFSADISGINFDFITVTGHTDRIGSHQYNLDLSIRRAEAVKAYLVDSAGVQADKIVARGAAESDPGTKPGECIGQKVTDHLITCLQPDRRVEVEVFGTQSPQ